MIRLTIPNSSGYTTAHITPDQIVSVRETGTSSQWHGIRSIVRTTAGERFECSETADWIMHQIDNAAAPTREPLTRERVRQMVQHLGYDKATMQERADFINGIRAGENAHGIGVERAEGGTQ